MRQSQWTAALSAAFVLGPVLLAAQGRGAGPGTPSAQSNPKGITAVPGIRVGSYTLAERPTGCTVVMVDGVAQISSASAAM